jgi:lipopolysaccharide export system permease protein
MSGFIAILLVTRLQEIARLAAFDSDMGSIVLFTLCQIPYILPIAIPISGLIASILLLQRLSHTHELTSFRSAGLSLKVISTPLLLVAFLLSLINFMIVSEVTPRTRLYSQKLLHQVMTTNPLFLMKKSKLLKLQSSYVDMNMTHVGKEARDVIFAMKNDSSDRLTLLTAKKFHVEDNQLIGKNVAIVSHLDSKDPDLFDHLIIENQRSMATSAKALSEMMQKNTFHLGYEYLPMNELIETAFSKTAKPKTIKRMRFELSRRLFFPLITYAFTFMGISLGLQIWRQKKKMGLILAIFLAAFTLICSMAAKSFHLAPTKAILCYVLPFPFILLTSFWFQKRAIEGIE